MGHENGDGPVPVMKAHHAPKKIHFRQTCPEGNPGCSPHNLCKTCPSECEACQNLRQTTPAGQCFQSDCFSCRHGYKHVPKHNDGRGFCEAAGTSFLIMAMGVSAGVLLIGAAIYVFCFNDRRQLGYPSRKKSSGSSSYL